MNSQHICKESIHRTEEDRYGTEKEVEKEEAEERLNIPPCDVDLTVLGLVASFSTHHHNC